MAQQTTVRSIPEYPFGMSNIQTVSGTANAITIGNNIISSFTQKLTETLTYNENAVYYLVLDRIEADGEKLRLAEPITANVTYQDKAYFCQSEDLGIFSASTELEDCLKDFQKEVIFVLNEYGKAKDDRLTQDAIELKRKILRYVNK